MPVSIVSLARTAVPLVLWSLLGCNSQVVATDDRQDLAIGPGPGPGVDLAGEKPDLGGPRDLAAGPDLGGKPPGSTCTSDGECVTGSCKPVGSGGGSICVGPCRSQADCAALPGGLFCAPKAVGDKEGYCIPPSALHCATCDKDADCGTLTERCSQMAGDIAPACHVDCSLSATACPTDYECVSVDEPGPPAVSRKLCAPKLKVCLDALGGFCDRVALPQSCRRDNVAGSCVGQRVCLAGGRYDKCAAMAPQYKRCGDMDPPGCMLRLAPDAATTKLNCGMCGKACAANEDCCGGSCKAINTATDCGACGKACAAGSDCCSGSCTTLNTVSNCGSCGNICPGQGLTNNDVFCDAMSRSCGMTCRGDNYDIDTNAGNGCEVLDVTPPGHSQPTASSRGSKPCSDTASADTFGSGVPSDKRAHINPPVDSFSGTVGAAPDWWTVHGDGGTFCLDDYRVTFTTMGGGSGMSCYMLTFITNRLTDQITVSGSSWNTISGGSGSYSDGSDIYFKIEKTCSTAKPENVTYTVDYHL